MLCCGSAEHKDMVRTFWQRNHIRNPKISASSSAASVQQTSSDVQQVSCTILQDYQNDIKKRFRNGGAPAGWKACLESQKTALKRALVTSSVDESTTGSSPNADDSLKLRAASKVTGSSALSTSTLEWRMDAFLLFSDDYQQYTDLFLLICILCYCCVY